MDHTNYFNHVLLKHIQKGGISKEGKESFGNIQKLLKHIMLRRTKVERADDLGLPLESSLFDGTFLTRRRKTSTRVSTRT